MPVLNGLFHVHSDYSYDGKLSLEKIKSACKHYGFDFVILAEHSQSLDDKKAEEFRKKCRELSDGDVVLIPSVEYSCEGGMHIVGLGVSEIISETKVDAVIKKIRDLGGFPIMAHPTKYENFNTEGVEGLGGVELWNFSYDGLWPRKRGIEIFSEMKKKDENLLSFFGLDLHYFYRFFLAEKLLMSMKIESEKTEKTVIAALRNGEFYFENLFFCSDSKGNVIMPKMFSEVSAKVYDFSKSSFKFFLKVKKKLRRR
ncbi:hypothetical protein A3K63_01125 [Candidatus Micrarchaeota archaeon RBG_16_49_10]|nr:MAG: hypothetical protein A3K63_01125 [Candidatus Micrarchaeota archaeon RBG_16_49_10]